MFSVAALPNAWVYDYAGDIGVDGVPIFDYAPGTLLGVGILLLMLGRIAPWPVIRDKNERIAYLESALQKSIDAHAVTNQALAVEQAAHGETRRMLAEEQKTGEIVRNLFDGLANRQAE